MAAHSVVCGPCVPDGGIGYVVFLPGGSLDHQWSRRFRCLFLLARRLRRPMQWQENINYRSVAFAPFLCGVATIAYVGQMGSYL